MKTFEEYLRLASEDGPPRSGIILGIRMALAGLKELGVEDPDRFKPDLVVVLETDRCLPDAVELVTGCRLGNRRLKLKDMGKMAATLIDVITHRAIRVAARENANQRALEMFPELEKEQALEKAYGILPDEELFSRKFVRVQIAQEDLPGYQSARVPCAMCGESIAFGREIIEQGRALCRSCAGQGYFESL
ncbi:MAG: TraR/DksA C4-type zinc finger protein [Acidobacteria bacterium]|nr:TraR/DksA C4-type zinc finger protein [Acidobacteriota bacterium]